MLPKRNPSTQIEKHSKISTVVSMMSLPKVEEERRMRDVVVSQSIKYSIHRVFTADFDFTFKSTKYRTTVLLYF